MLKQLQFISLELFLSSIFKSSEIKRYLMLIKVNNKWIFG